MYHGQNMLTHPNAFSLKPLQLERKDENVAPEGHPREAVALGLAQEDGNSNTFQLSSHLTQV